MSIFSRCVLFASVGLLSFLPSHLVAATPDTLAMSPQAKAIAASVDEMSEPELVLLLDSLFDADCREPNLYSLINVRIDSLRSESPKNVFNTGFSMYPANRFYGVWDTKHLFPYGDSLYKADTLTTLDLSSEVSGEFVFPHNGPITSTYGWRDTAYHRGIDIDLNLKDSVVAAFGGMVRFAGKCGGYGNVIIIRHYNGLETVYGHLCRIKVKPGDIVTSGELIGLGGSTGHSTGTHLHFETRFRGVAIDPAFLIDLKTHKLIAEKVALVRTKQGYAVRPAGQDFHTVVRGDNLVKIANHYGITVNQLRAWNGWEGYVRLRAGQQVRVSPPEITAASF